MRTDVFRSGRVHFRNEVINEGGGWDPLHAEFVAPAPGLYQIAYTALPGSNSILGLSVQRNSEVILRGYGDRQLSGQILLQLQSRDRVWLRVSSGAIYEDPTQLQHAYTVLSGYMITPRTPLTPCSENIKIGSETTESSAARTTVKAPIYRRPVGGRQSLPVAPVLAPEEPLAGLAPVLEAVTSADSTGEGIVLPKPK